jgi:hypothetical protein
VVSTRGNLWQCYGLEKSNQIGSILLHPQSLVKTYPESAATLAASLTVMPILVPNFSQLLVFRFFFTP